MSATLLMGTINTQDSKKLFTNSKFICDSKYRSRIIWSGLFSLGYSGCEFNLKYFGREYFNLGYFGHHYSELNGINFSEYYLDDYHKLYTHTKHYSK